MPKVLFGKTLEQFNLVNYFRRIVDNHNFERNCPTKSIETLYYSTKAGSDKILFFPSFRSSTRTVALTVCYQSTISKNNRLIMFTRIISDNAPYQKESTKNFLIEDLGEPKKLVKFVILALIYVYIFWPNEAL